MKAPCQEPVSSSMDKKKNANNNRAERKDVAPPLKSPDHKDCVRSTGAAGDQAASHGIRHVVEPRVSKATAARDDIEGQARTPS